MKSLLIICAIVTSVTLQAASIKWGYFGTPLSASGLADESTFGAESTALLILANSGTTATTISEIIAGGNLGTLTTFGSSVLDVPGVGLVVGDANTSDNLILTTSPTLAAGTYACYLAVFNTQFAPIVGDSFMLSEGKEVELTADGSNLPIGSVSFDKMGAWTTIVPEPTVLALLALGVAGLALRRRA